ncbi:hypothetical protein D3C71_1837830 [compost metagenome]
MHRHVEPRLNIVKHLVMCGCKTQLTATIKGTATYTHQCNSRLLDRILWIIVPQAIMFGDQICTECAVNAGAVNIIRIRFPVRNHPCLPDKLIT